MAKKYRWITPDESSWVKDENGYSFPNDPSNKKGEEFREWLLQGNIPDPYKTSEEIESDQLDSLKDKKWDKIIIPGMVYGEYTIDMDPISFLMLKATIDEISLGTIDSIQWKCRDKKWLTLDQTNAQQIKLLGLQFINDAFLWEKSEQEKI